MTIFIKVSVAYLFLFFFCCLLFIYSYMIVASSAYTKDTFLKRK